LGLPPDEIEKRRLKILSTLYGAKIAIEFEVEFTLNPVCELQSQESGILAEAKLEAKKRFAIEQELEKCGW
jgi:hypothetical protein